MLRFVCQIITNKHMPEENYSVDFLDTYKKGVVLKL